MEIPSRFGTATYSYNCADTCSCRAVRMRRMHVFPGSLVWPCLGANLVRQPGFQMCALQSVCALGHQSSQKSYTWHLRRALVLYMSLARACCNPLQRCLQWACATAAPDQRITLRSCLYGASLVSQILRILVVASETTAGAVSASPCRCPVGRMGARAGTRRWCCEMLSTD